MRQGKVFVESRLAGIISETPAGFTFTYNKEYLQQEDALPVSITLPLQEEPFENKTLFSFFDGLIPEGWLLNIAERILQRFQKYKALWFECIDRSFIQEEQKAAYKAIISNRLDTLLR